MDAFSAWRDRRGTGNAEPRQILEAVRDFIDMHASSRFERIGTTGPVVHGRAGWVEGRGDGDVVHLFTRAGLREATSGHDMTRALNVLDRAGWLVPGPSGRRTQRKIGGCNVRLYVVSLPEEAGAC
jgi:putative DNA primase/helicase